MASVKYQQFLKRSEKIAFDDQHRSVIRFNMGRYDAAVEKGKEQFKDLELAKERAAFIKQKVINNLEKYLKEFEGNFERNGGRIIWAQDGHQAAREIANIARINKAKLVVKSKSMTTEEIGINEVLEHKGIECVETDLGEYIVQIAGEKPYHIVTPAMHKSKEDIAALFHEKFDTPADSKPEELTAFVREKLREKFVRADMGITGGNFLIADTGSVALTENEGNGLMTLSWPKIHIAVVGIEKIIPSIQDLHLFWPLLASQGTGQYMTVYNSIISGPRQEGELDGPDHMYLILLDNKRTEILEQKEQKIALSCIRCGACLNACPVYRNVGGHTYDATYSGPIGSIISPFMKGFDQYNHLSYACSLCGKCTEVCPVKIPLHELLLKNRSFTVEKGYNHAMDNRINMGWKMIMMKRKRLDFFGAGLKNLALKLFARKIWGPRRELPAIAKKSFRQQWQERKK